jgi:LPXTG-motif cell wall-anchored protein
VFSTGPGDDIYSVFGGKLTLELPEGYNYIELRARDNAGNGWNTSGPHRIRINMGQEAKLVEPVNNTVYKLKDQLTLTAQVTENTDGDELEISWFSDVNGYLGNGTTLTMDIKGELDVGNHTISMYVDDGHGHNITDSVVITIKKPKDPSTGLGDMTTWYLLIALIIAIVAIVSMVLILKRKKDQGGDPETVSAAPVEPGPSEGQQPVPGPAQEGVGGAPTTEPVPQSDPSPPPDQGPVDVPVQEEAPPPPDQGPADTPVQEEVPLPPTEGPPSSEAPDPTTDTAPGPPE